jgi:hypothetical protein
MPCYDATPPTTEENDRINKTATLFKYSLEWIGFEVASQINDAAGDPWTKDHGIEPAFCLFLGNLKREFPEKLDELLASTDYRLKDVKAWWIDHQIQDAVFAGRPSEFPEREQAIRTAALKKLTRVEATMFGQSTAWDIAHNFVPPQE